MAASGLHISLSAEPIFDVGGFAITNSMFMSLIVSSLLIIFAVIVKSQLQSKTKPTGIQNVGEWIVESLYNLVYSITGDVKKTKTFFPFIATFFLFILLNNWLGLLPGVGSITKLMPAEPVSAVEETALSESTADAISEIEVLKDEHAEAETTKQETVVNDDHTGVVAQETNSVTGEKTEDSHSSGPVKTPIFRPGTADLNTTLALGLITIFMTQFYGVQFLKLSYFTKFFNFSSPIMFFVGILELFSEIGKIISFAFRLFGNVFAGEVLLTVIMSLVGLIIPMPFYALEIFVGFIQALVFAMLSLVFFNMATISHAEHD